MWSPLLVPQMEGGLTPVWPVTAKVSVQIPVPEAMANPEKVSKSNLSWHTSSEAFEMVKVHDPVAEGVYELGYVGF